MRTRFFVGATIALWILSLLRADFLNAQNISGSLTISYSNSIYGEIDPCPT